MTPVEFERRHAASWDRLEARLELLSGLRKSGKGSKGESLASGVDELPTLYRETCHHLALARDRGYPAYLTHRLNTLVQRGHQLLYRPRRRFWAQAWHFFTVGFPERVRADARYVWIATAFFLLPGVGIGALVHFMPEMVYSVMGPGQVIEMERMYDPAGQVVGRARAGDTDFMMFGFYIRNNITVSFQAFASGLIPYVGTLFYMVFNGLQMGAVAAHLTNVGFGVTFWPFVCGHGSFELTAIVLSSAAGLKLSHALVAPGRLTRRAALVKAGRESVQLMYGVIFMLVIAAFIEAFWSSSRWIPSEGKYAMAGLLWAMVLYYLCLQGRARGDVRGAEAGDGRA